LPALSKFTYWAAAFGGIAVWTGSIVSLSTLPLPTEIALGAMGAVGAVWGHAVMFPKSRPSGGVASPGGASREDMLSNLNLPAQPAGALRRTGQARARELPLPINAKARQEAIRLADSLNAIGVFGPVSVRIEADGTALIAPLLEGEPVRVSAALVNHFTARALQSPERLAQHIGESGTWPGRELASALAAHIDQLERQPTRPASPPDAVRLWNTGGGLLGAHPHNA